MVTQTQLKMTNNVMIHPTTHSVIHRPDQNSKNPNFPTREKIKKTPNPIIKKMRASERERERRPETEG